MTDQTVPNESSTMPHFVLVPLMAQGHMIPMIDMARLLASRGATVTFITTPANAARIGTIISRVEQSGLPLRFLSLWFPSTDFGLPEGSENIDTLPTRNLLKNFYDAARTLCDPLVVHLRSCHPPPSCIISDNTHHWTQEVAREFSIPRLVFHGFGLLPLLSRHNIRSFNIHEMVRDENERFVVPGLPDFVEITRARVQSFFAVPGLEKLRQELKEAESMADGVIVNSFDDLEPSYAEFYSKAIGKKVWTIGPLSLYSRDIDDLAARGDKASIDKEQCLLWLDSMKPRSVIYVSFGSLANINFSQLIEIGLGLEASNCPFLWVIRPGASLPEVEDWLSNGFEERMKGRGLIIRGWAPQVMILSHPSIGGFVSHCGWNSMLESVCVGIPMVTWPLFAEQFLNEKLIVDMLKMGVPVGVETPSAWGVETGEVLVKKNDVQKAVQNLMNESDGGKERRKRAEEFCRKARRAVEDGGSSFANLTQLINSMKLD